MLTFTIIGSLVGVALALGARHLFNRHTLSRFGHCFLEWGPLLLGAATLWLVWIGLAMAHKSGESVALVIAAVVAAALFSVLVVLNIRKTDPLIGLCGSAAQVVMCAVIAVAAPVIVVVWAAFALFRHASCPRHDSEAPFTHYASTGNYHGNGNRHVFPPSVRIP